MVRRLFTASVSLHDLVQFPERNTSASHLFQDGILRYSLNYSFECMCLTFLAHLAYTWVYSELRMLDIKTQEKSRTSCGWRRSCSFFVHSVISGNIYIFSKKKKSFTTKVAHSHFIELLLPVFTSWTRPSADEWEIQRGSRMSVIFKLPANSEHLVRGGEEGSSVKGSPCVPCQHHENSTPRGGQGGVCALFIL